MTKTRGKLFYLLPGLLVFLLGCPPEPPREAQEAGTFLLSKNKLYDIGSDFDLRWKVVYPATEKTFDPSTNISNKELAQNRCTICHECGFEKAFDYAHFGQPGWAPQYKGQRWSSSVERMVGKEGSMLNEQIAGRIFEYLRDVTLGKYDENVDPKGAMIIETDNPPAQPGAPPAKETPEQAGPAATKP
jgi:hypothetical protein